jgi:hypothetical protein
VAARDAVSSPNRLAASSNLWSDETDALAGRADQQDGGPCQPDDLPGGLPHGHPWAERAKRGRRLRQGSPTGGRAVGLRQVDGMALSGQGSPAWPEQLRSGR